MRSRRVRYLCTGSHVALRTERGNYTPAWVLKDDGGEFLKVRYRRNGARTDGWVSRSRLSPGWNRRHP
jgi:hypothetical protein